MIPRDITPTEEQAQKIAEINAWFERAVQPLRDEEQRRMELVSRTYRVYDSEDRVELEKEVVETSLQPCTPNRIDIKFGLKTTAQTK